MASLHGRGWRQGTVFVAELPLDVIVLVAGGEAQRQSSTHERWVVASQNCDLDSADDAFSGPVIEIRPVFTENSSTDWGIRSAKFLLRDAEYVVSSSGRQMVSPALLTAFDARGVERHPPLPEREVAFTTWLGLRYDRPAVPNELIPLAKKISEEVRRPASRADARAVRDVLMEFDAGGNPPRYSLFAVVVDDADCAAVRAWLARVAHAVPLELGIADRIEAAPASGVSFELIERTYAADASQLTWRANQPGADGAV